VTTMTTASRRWMLLLWLWSSVLPRRRRERIRQKRHPAPSRPRRRLSHPIRRPGRQWRSQGEETTTRHHHHHQDHYDHSRRTVASWPAQNIRRRHKTWSCRSPSLGVHRLCGPIRLHHQSMTPCNTDICCILLCCVLRIKITCTIIKNVSERENDTATARDKEGGRERNITTNHHERPKESPGVGVFASWSSSPSGPHNHYHHHPHDMIHDIVIQQKQQQKQPIHQTCIHTREPFGCCPHLTPILPWPTANTLFVFG
jgi:hypothetical protein